MILLRLRQNGAAQTESSTQAPQRKKKRITMHFIPAPMEVEVVEKTPDVPVSLGIDVERPSTAVRVPSQIRRLSREPLVHFLLAGIVLFAATTLFERQTSASKTIHVTSAEVQRLQDVWARQYGRNPSSAELQNLIDDHIRE